MGLTEFCWVWTECSQVKLGLTRFYTRLTNLFDIAEFDWSLISILPSLTRFLLGFTGIYWILLSVNGLYQGLLMISRLWRGFIRLSLILNQNKKMSSTSSLAFFLSHHLFFFIFLNVRHVRLFVCFFLATDRFLRPIKSLLGVVPRRPFHNPPSSTSPDFGGAVRNPADNAAGISGISSGNLHTHTHTHTRAHRQSFSYQSLDDGRRYRIKTNKKE